MNRKPGSFPFVHSQIALLILSLTMIGRPVSAEPNEAPAVLQFARKYQQELIDVPQYKPSKKASKPERKNSPVPKKSATSHVDNKPLITESDRRQLLQLQNNVVLKEQEISAQSSTIQKLEKQLSVLQQAAKKASDAAAAIPVASPQDVQMVQKMIESLYRTFTLRPGPDSLAENLKQANQQAANARLAEAAMLEKQKELRLQIGELQNQLATLKNNRVAMSAEREASLNSGLEKLNTQNHQLESELAVSRQKSSQAAVQIQQLETSIRKLESDNKQYAEDNKQLMLQISGHSSASETIELVKKQQNKLQDELASRQQQLTQLEDEKQRLQQQLSAAPTVAQLVDSQQKVKALQNQLDANVQLLQKQEISASEQVKASNATLLADKQSADKKIKVLQDKLDAMQAQQTALLAEKQQFQQRLQTDLKGNEQYSAALSAQMKELQDKLAATQQQQQAVVAEKDKLQRQLDNAPTAAQLADSQQKMKALQAQLDTAMLLQKKGSSASEQIQASNVTLLAEKTAVEDKVKALQQELSSAREQQKAMQAEKQQLQNKLQTDLKGNEKSHTALTMQLKELQDKLAAAQQQQSVIQGEKVQLQHKLDSVPDAAQLADSQLKIKALQGQLDTALMLQKKDNAAGDVAKTDGPILTAEYKAAEDKIKQLQLKLDATQAQLTEAAKQSTSPKVKGLQEVTSETLKKKSTREAYAIGISLGTEILQLQAENRNWASTDSDKPSVLAGIIDSFQGKEKLPPDELHKALMNISERVKSGREKYMGDLDKSTKKFIANFTKQKNVKKSDSGFWYRVGYAGDALIPAGATIDVVVKESLTNGIVIEDMDAKGIVLTQPISAFPPIFREALSKLKNHGSITIVVPPALAYGDKGYPPKVPPNATMVYELRVSDIYPEQTKKQ